MDRPFSDPLERVVDDIYEAALNPDGWPRALAETTRFIGAATSDLYILTPSALCFSSFAGAPDRAITEYITEWRYEVDQLAFPSLLKARTGDIFSDEVFVTPRQVVHLPFYRKYLRELDLESHFLSGVVLNTIQEKILLVVRCQRVSGLQNREKLRKLHRLLPHIRRAVHIHNQFCIGLDSNARLSSAMNAFSVGIVLFASSGCITYTNDIARDLIDSHEQIDITAAQLRMADLQLNNRFRTHLRGILNSASPDAGSDSIALLAPPLSLVLTPLPDGTRLHHGSGALLTISTPDGRIAPSSIELLRTLFRLTTAEAGLAVDIANGASPAEHAERRSICLETVRSHLKSILAKTGVHRQVELVRLINNCIMPLRSTHQCEPGG